MIKYIIGLLFTIDMIFNCCAFNINSFHLNRRDLLKNTAYYTVLPNNKVIPNEKPICIIGANGETGRECVNLLLEQNRNVRAVSRKNVNIKNKNLENFLLDIRDEVNIKKIIKDVSGVIFLANAKKKYKYIKTDEENFQNYEEIDVLALENIAKECINQNIPKLVYVSAACKSCISNPSMAVDKICGIECENCLTKQAGEKIIRNLYKSAPNGVDYTIIRIGYLFNGENRGAKEIELNQDYTKSGMISRTDLANVCINTLSHPKTSRSTFEAYYIDTTQPYDVRESLRSCTNLGKSVEECFFGSEYKDRKPTNMEEVRKKPVRGSLFTTGNEYHGKDWSELFKNLKSDNLLKK